MAALLLCRQLLCLRTSTIIIIIIIGIHIINNKVDASARVTYPLKMFQRVCSAFGIQIMGGMVVIVSLLKTLLEYDHSDITNPSTATPSRCCYTFCL